MRAHLNDLASRVLVATVSLVAAAVSAQVSAQVFTIIDQHRSTSSMVIVPQCRPGTIMDGDTATDFGPFSSDVSASLMCDAATATATALQDSQVESDFIASGQTSAFAFSIDPDVIHSMSFSDYDITFQVLKPASFSLSAQLEAGGNLPVFSASDSSLISDNGAVVFQNAVQQGSSPNSVAVVHSGQLQPGQYSFQASCSSVIDSVIPPNGSGNAAFDVQLVIVALGDVDDDGSVGPADLGQLLASWGRCPPDDVCLSDLDGDGSVDPADLAMLLASWD